MPGPAGSMEEALDATRVFIYTHVADKGVPPTSCEIAEHFQITLETARERLAALAATKRIITSYSTGEIWMCGPFSALPTRFRVHGPEVSWWANCAWDMIGIPASLGVSARIHTSCACCDESAGIQVDAETGPREEVGIVHILLPARRWYEDIGFT
jgi:hypothetical protein